MEATVNLDSENLNDFLRCLTNLREVCNDVDIRSGVVRQRSNDLTSVFEMDLTPLLTADATFAITDLKKKLDLLKTFQNQDINLEIVDNGAGDSYFKFSDQYSSIKFIAPTLEFMDNKWMSDEELQNIFSMNEDDLIMQTEISSIITDRIKLVTDNFNTEAIQVIFTGEEASIVASTQSRDQFAKFIEGIPTNVILENSSSNLTTVPFSIDHDTDVVFKMFKDPNQAVSLNKISTTLGDIDISVYARSSIMSDED